MTAGLFSDGGLLRNKRAREYHIARSTCIGCTMASSLSFLNRDDVGMMRQLGLLLHPSLSRQ